MARNAQGLGFDWGCLSRLCNKTDGIPLPLGGEPGKSMKRVPFLWRPGRWLAAIAGGMLWCAVTAWALDPGKSILHFNVHNWTRQNGLPVDKIGAIAQTDDGYLWLGTQNGLVRFDGMEFKTVPIELPEALGADVSALDESRGGGLWFAIREGGFGHFDGRRFSAIPDVRWAEPFVAASQILEAKDGSVWTGTYMGLGRWAKGRTDETFFQEPIGSVLVLHEEPDGGVWVGTAEHGVFYRKDGQVVEMADEELKALNVYGVVRDRSGEIWIGTNRGLRRYDADGRFIRLELIDLSISALLLDSHGVLWIGTSGAGLGRFKDGAVAFLSKVDGLGSDRVTALFEDHEGSLWVGTVDGLSQLTDLKFPIYSSEVGIARGDTLAVAASRAGGVWIGTVAGVSYFDGSRGTTYFGDEFLANPYARRVFEASDGKVYVGDGSHRINVLQDGRRVGQFRTDDWVEAMVEDSRGLVFSVGGKLMRLRGERLEPYEFEAEQEPALGWINNLLVTKDGALWVASNTGVARIQNGFTQRWLTSDGLGSDRVYCLVEDDDGGVWVGLPTGLARIKDQGVVNIGEGHGLHDARIYAIVPDDHGYFWFSSGRGIFRVRRSELRDVAEGKEAQVRSEGFDGLESVKFTDRTEQGLSGCKSEDGRIWFPNPHGVVMIDPVSFHRNKVPPPVHIQHVMADGVEIDPQKRGMLAVGTKRLEISFVALSYVAPKKVRLEYRLEGMDHDWIESGGRRSVLYNNLPPGDYVFRARAANADGEWNTAGARFAFTLPPPFYQTAWFYLLCALGAGATLFGAHGWRVRRMEARAKRLQAENDLLEAKVRERTEEMLEISRHAGMAEVATSVLHNVGNVLNSVNVSTTLLSERLRHTKASQVAKLAALVEQHQADLGEFVTKDPRGRMIPDYLKKLADSLADERSAVEAELAQLQANVENIKQIVAMQEAYAGPSGMMETIELVELVEDALRIHSDSLARHGVKVRCEFEARPVIRTDKHKVIQILINLIRNAETACIEGPHAEKRIRVRTTASDGWVRIEVIDNGVGIPPENLTRIFQLGFTTRAQGRGFGLHTGALAAKELGGALRVRSDGPGRGATFTLELPAEAKRGGA